MERIDFEVRSLNKEYNNSDRFSAEKRFDYVRFLVASLPFKREVATLYEEELKLHEEYSKSIVPLIKTNIENCLYPEYLNLVKEETMNVDFLVTKNGKEKVVSDLKVSDYLIDFIYTTKKLKFYIKAFKMHNKKECDCLEELIKNTNDVIKMMILDHKHIDVAKDWLNFLEEKAPVNKKEIAHNTIVGEIENISEFSEEQRVNINRYTKLISSELEKLQDDRVKTR
ncbi:TPA: hypothetical protein GXZ34_02725 [bacterium]|nr:hypothetical protein [bacterium]